MEVKLLGTTFEVEEIDTPEKLQVQQTFVDELQSVSDTPTLDDLTMIVDHAREAIDFIVGEGAAAECLGSSRSVSKHQRAFYQLTKQMGDCFDVEKKPGFTIKNR